MGQVAGIKPAKTAASPDVSDFEATLAMLPPRLAARLSLGPSRDTSPQVPRSGDRASACADCQELLLLYDSSIESSCSASSN